MTSPTPERPKVYIGSIYACNNTEDGIRSEGVDLVIGRAVLNNNGGKGINVVDADIISEEDCDAEDAPAKVGEPSKWHERPAGIISITIFCGLIVAFCAYYFGWTK